MTKIYNKTTEKEKRRQLRKNLAPAEIKLWQALKNKQVAGYKFRRQYSVEKYVVDFYCPVARLAIEVDGRSHDVSDEVREYDRQRQEFIESFGIRFLRFMNNDIYHNLRGVVQKIEIVCQELDKNSEGEKHDL